MSEDGESAWGHEEVRVDMEEEIVCRVVHRDTATYVMVIGTGVADGVDLGEIS